MGTPWSSLSPPPSHWGRGWAGAERLPGVSQRLACLWAVLPYAVEPALGVSFLRLSGCQQEVTLKTCQPQTQLPGLLPSSLLHTSLVNGGVGREKGLMPEQLDVIVPVRLKCLFCYLGLTPLRILNSNILYFEVYKFIHKFKYNREGPAFRGYVLGKTEKII